MLSVILPSPSVLTSTLMLSWRAPHFLLSISFISFFYFISPLFYYFPRKALGKHILIRYFSFFHIALSLVLRDSCACSDSGRSQHKVKAFFRNVFIGVKDEQVESLLWKTFCWSSRSYLALENSGFIEEDFLSHLLVLIYKRAFIFSNLGTDRLAVDESMWRP